VVLNTGDLVRSDTGDEGRILFFNEGRDLACIKIGDVIGGVESAVYSVKNLTKNDGPEPPDSAVETLRQQCLDALRTNRRMVERVMGNPDIDDLQKVAFANRMIDSSQEIQHLMSLLEARL
jgi:hypothetical protein